MVFHSFKTTVGQVDYQLQRSRRRRSIEISIDENAEVRVRAPQSVTLQQIEDFLKKKTAWLEKNRQAVIRKKKEFETRYDQEGKRFLFLGQRFPYLIREEQRKYSRVTFNGKEWIFVVPAHLDERDKKEQMQEVLRKWYVAQAKEFFAGRIFHYARIMKVKPVEINVRTQRRIWGSCHHSSGKINLNWQLVLSPLGVIDYVVVHELCHLIHPNHSTRFWKKVENMMPDFRNYVKWLKNNHLEIKWLSRIHA